MINQMVKMFRRLCAPAKVYFSLSMLSILGILTQNISCSTSYKIGNYSCDLASHNISFFVFKILYVIGWTFILQELCKNKYVKLAWFLILMPFIFFAGIIALLVMMEILK
jgi:hypothetical protein